jgi:hypothetical protein
MIFVLYIPSYLQTLLLWMLFRRHAHRTSPFFFAYTAFGVAAGVARFLTNNHHLTYYLTYWITEAVYDVLGILVMYEVFRTVLGRLAQEWWTRPIFPGILIVSICLSFLQSHATAEQLGGWLMLYFVVGEMAVRFVQVLMFALLLPPLGLRWPRYPSGIATGFGVYATVMLFTTIRFLDLGRRFKLLWGWSSIVAYSVAVLIWIWTFRRPQGSEAAAEENPLGAKSDPLRRRVQRSLFQHFSST